MSIPGAGAPAGDIFAAGGMHPPGLLAHGPEFKPGQAAGGQPLAQTGQLKEHVGIAFASSTGGPSGYTVAAVLGRRAPAGQCWAPFVGHNHTEPQGVLMATASLPRFLFFDARRMRKAGPDFHGGTAPPPRGPSLTEQKGPGAAASVGPATPVGAGLQAAVLLTAGRAERSGGPGGPRAPVGRCSHAVFAAAFGAGAGPSTILPPRTTVPRCGRAGGQVEQRGALWPPPDLHPLVVSFDVPECIAAVRTGGTALARAIAPCGGLGAFPPKVRRGGPAGHDAARRRRAVHPPVLVVDTNARGGGTGGGGAGLVGAPAGAQSAKTARGARALATRTAGRAGVLSAFCAPPKEPHEGGAKRFHVWSGVNVSGAAGGAPADKVAYDPKGQPQAAHTRGSALRGAWGAARAGPPRLAWPAPLGQVAPW